jgi:hypothetical protein
MFLKRLEAYLGRCYVASLFEVAGTECGALVVSPAFAGFELAVGEVK